MAQQQILGHQCVAVAHGRAEKAEQEQQVLEHRPTSCRSRPADVPSDFCTPTVLADGGCQWLPSGALICLVAIGSSQNLSLARSLCAPHAGWPTVGTCSDRRSRCPDRGSRSAVTPMPSAWAAAWSRSAASRPGMNVDIEAIADSGGSGSAGRRPLGRERAPAPTVLGAATTGWRADSWWSPAAAAPGRAAPRSSCRAGW